EEPSQLIYSRLTRKRVRYRSVPAALWRFNGEGAEVLPQAGLSTADSGGSPADKERILNDGVPTFREAAGAAASCRETASWNGRRSRARRPSSLNAIAMEDGVPLDRGHLGGKEPVSSEWRRLNLRSSPPISRSFSTSFKRSRTSSAK